MVFCFCFLSCVTLIKDYSSDQIVIDYSEYKKLSLVKGTDYIQSKINNASTEHKGVLFTKGNYTLSRTIQVRNGILTIIGNDARIDTKGSFIMFHLIGRKNGENENVQNVKIQGLKIDANFYADGNGVIPFKGENISNCTFKNIVIENMRLGHGILIMNNEGFGKCTGNKILNNHISGESGIDLVDKNLTWYAISLSSELVIKMDGLSFVDSFKESGIAPSSSNSISTTLIQGNIIKGGYYGINVITGASTEVSNNSISDNTRNMSFQWGCTNNLIENNKCFKTLSSAILLAYGANENIIRNNFIQSDRWIGEGLIKIGLASNDNLVENNVLVSNDLEGGEYFIYIHIDASRNRIKNNTMHGACRKAYLALETAWNKDFIDNLHFAKNKPYDFDGLSHSNMSKNELIENQAFNSKDSMVPLIYLGEIEDNKNGLFRLIETNIVDNKINGRNIGKNDIVRKIFNNPKKN